MIEPTQSGTEFNNSIVEQLISSNPELLRILIEINSKKQENQLLGFIRRQQCIMQEQLVTEKIPNLKANIEDIRTKLSYKEGLIEQTKNMIEKTKADIEAMKKRIAAKYQQKRANQQYQKLLESKASMLRRSRKASASKSKNTSAIKKQTHQKIIHNICKISHNFVNHTEVNQYTSNKQNLNTINTITKTITKPENNSENQSFKLIKLKTDNTITQSKINSLKQEIKKKQRLLDQTKKEKKKIQDNVEMKGSTIQSKRVSSRGSSSVVRSEFVSVQESDSEDC